MNIPSFLSEKKSIAVELVVLCLFLGGIYYAYITFSEQSPVTATTASDSQQLLGEHFVTFLKATSENTLSLTNTEFLRSSDILGLKDYSEIISPNSSRGRLDPFIPYATSRPLR